MRRRRLLRAAAGLVAAVVVAGTVACGGSDAATAPAKLPIGCPTDAMRPLTLVVGARMGSPRPELPDEVLGLLGVASERGQKVQVIRLDGQPSVALTAVADVEAKNDAVREKRIAAAVKRVTSAIGSLKPKAPEADVLGALAEAARVTPAGGTVAVVDSGIATTGAVSFRDEGMFGAEPAEVANFLATQQLLPQLSGKAVLLVGFGGAAAPQTVLDDNLRGRVNTLWRTLAEKSGAACVGELSVPSRRDAVSTKVPVTPVALPAPPKFESCGTTVLPDSDSVGFVPNTAELRDPAAAGRTLQQLAGQLVGHTQRVTLIGNTASVGPPAGNVALSQQRAEAVKQVLARLGVQANRITTRGDGNTGKYHENDLGPGGVLIPAAAARNRSVVVEVSCEG